jgi:hypothetical protein
MSVDVGDAFELTFTTVTGATVTVSWYDPDLQSVFEGAAVSEAPTGSGKYPRTFVADSPGLWHAVFTASGTATAVEDFWVRALPLTGLPPLATLGEVADQFGTMTEAQEGLARSLLRAASKLVRQRVPAVDANIAAGRLDPEVVGLAVVNMVLRVMRNPRGLRSETTGPFSVTYDSATAAGQVVISGDDLLIFTPTPKSAAGAVGTIWVTPALGYGYGRGHGW